MTHSRMLDFPGHEVRLELDVLDAPMDHGMLASLALKGMFTFSQRRCVPLALEVGTAYWEDEFDIPVKDPARRANSRMLRCKELPPGTVTPRPDWPDEEVTTVEQVDEDTTWHFVRELIEVTPKDPEGMSIGWTDMNVYTGMIRLPRNFSGAEATTISIAVAGGVVDHPITRVDGDAWVYGPLPTTLHAPLEYRIHRRSGKLILDISLYWDLWTENDAGATDIRRGIDALVDLGWRIA